MTWLRRFLTRPSRDRRALVEAFLLLALARAALTVVPFRRLAAWLGTPATGSTAPSRAEEGEVEIVGRAIATAARHLPWDSRCFAQSLAATAMLRRRGLASITSLGVAREPGGGLRAHAWTRCGDLPVAGGDEAARYQVVAIYRSDPRP